MTQPTKRELIDPRTLLLPNCPIPRPGDEVIWYTDACMRKGKYLGFGPEAMPIVNSGFGVSDHLRSFEEIRLSSPENRVGPIWYNLPADTIHRPHLDETAKFKELLLRRIPPGPSYLELIHEIWYRGFEVFLVGGTVRDVLSGSECKDIDLVTTIPLKMALNLMSNMFRGKPSVDEKNGFVRLGGTPKSGDPFIDLKSFVFKDPGTNHAVFAGDFEMDVKHRDFACNSIYYDPVNNALFDPCTRGINAAEQKLLEIVSDPFLRSPYHKGTIVIRLCKFITRGFKCTDHTISQIHSYFIAELNAMEASQIANYIKIQFFSKSPTLAKAQVLEAIEEVFIKINAENAWKDKIAPALKSAGMIEVLI